VLIDSCRKDEPVASLPGTPLTTVTIQYPSYFPMPTYRSDNPLTAEGIALGRMLYYDTLLSNNGNSCSSCHKQSEGFSSASSNSLAHTNLAWQTYFLWNGGVEGMVEEAMIFEVEEFFHSDLSVLNNSPVYKPLFRQVFGVNVITSREVAYALAQFVRSLVSFDSKYDRYLRYELNLSPDELIGYYVFNSERGDCFHCHAAGLLCDNRFHNTGLDSVYTSANAGRYTVTGDPNDLGKFKTPTLRNIELTAPYMHDGRFQTLEEVVEFYNSGVHVTATVDPIMTKPGKENGLQLTPQEKAGLIAFLKTFTDTVQTRSPAFSDPN
jgi:cytochrome c peroxidase